jgi:hypothetical protein
MSSGSIQLSVVGLQDEYLTGSPDVTYFIKRFNRHTKFALETLSVPFNQTTIDFGSWVNVIIPRNGQLIRNMYVKLVLPALTSGGYTNGIGNAIIQYADLVIGGQIIERINGEYMHMYDETFISDSQQVALTYMAGTTPTLDGPRTGDRVLGWRTTAFVRVLSTDIHRCASVLFHPKRSARHPFVCVDSVRGRGKDTVSTA